MHVLIVGSGIGGLTLAQCLRKQGISLEIFERTWTRTRAFRDRLLLSTRMTVLALRILPKYLSSAQNGFDFGTGS
ncbi:hypothetical protein JMJ35_007406 [Cladonia borealis]|uniref:FAD-binding domain-containing protein n=1 Tax=Cladonia borealis TaxID=184061 RepID=A0AA39UZR0_9LECA|nr:hypothetical protein JMJ35_007406 [Cladonia borealis]